MAFLKKKFLLICLLFSSVSYGQSSLIYRAKSSKPGEMTLSPGFVFRKMDVRVAKAAVGAARPALKIERHMLGLGFAMGIGKRVDAFGYGAYHIKSEFEGVAKDDSGFVLGGGLKLLAVKFSESAVYAFFDLNYTRESYDSDLKASYIETHIGAMARMKVTETLNLMGGVEFIPYFSGDGNFGGVKDKLENRNSLSIVAGVVMPFINVRGEGSFLGNSSFSAAADFKVKEGK